MEYEEPKQITEEMKSGLARLYGDTGIRAYFVHSINVANQNIINAVSVNKTDEARLFTFRLKTFKDILEKGKTCFVESEKRQRSEINSDQEIKL